jgi:hypothetical protein
VVELVVPESPMAQGSPAEEQPQLEDHDVEDKADEEYPPPSVIEDEKMYRDVDEVESFRAEAPVPTSRLWAMLEHLGITTAPRYRIKEMIYFPKKNPVDRVHQSRGPVAGGPPWTPGGGGQGASRSSCRVAFSGTKPHRERTKRRRVARGISP